MTKSCLQRIRVMAVVAFALLSVFLLASCRKSGGGNTGALTLNGAGATFPYPLYAKWIDEYKAVNPDLNINYQSIGSGGGIKELTAGTVDFGASDAPLSDEDQQAMPGKVLHLPMTAGAVVVAYHLPGVKQGLKLTPEVLAGIYLGTITKWSDRKITALSPGVKLPTLAIAVVHRSDGSGTSFLFTSYLAAVDRSWAKRVGAGKSVNWPAGIGGKGNEGVAGVLKQTPGSIGYVELAFAEQNGLAYAALRNSAGEFVQPSIASVQAAAAAVAEKMRTDVRVSLINAPGKQAYPISGFTYIMIYADQADARKGEALLAFLKWANTDGQQYAGALQYAPLPQAVTAMNTEALQGVTLAGKAQ